MKVTALIIESLPRGGFMVREQHRDMALFMLQLPLTEALQFIKQELGGPREGEANAVVPERRSTLDEESQVEEEKAPMGARR